MEDITFDSYGVNVRQQESILMNKYRDKLSMKFDALVKSLDEYQTDIVFNKSIESPLKITANAGCLTGNAIIRFSRAGKGFKVKLKDAFLRFNGLDKYPSIWRKDIETKVRSLYREENRIKLNEIINIVESGVKPIIKIILKNGFELECTLDHKIMTKGGWIEANNLKFEDCVCVDTLHRYQETSLGKFKSFLRDSEKTVGKYHPFSRKCLINKGRQTILRVSLHRLIYEANKNNMNFEDFISATHNKEITSKLYFVDTTKNCIHHKDFDHYNNEVNNLQEMDRVEHLKLHSPGYFNFKHGVPEYIKVKEIINLNKKQMTYDIICEEPHNFIANNIVVHNSGKTQCLLAKALKMVIKDGIYPGSIVLITFTNKAANEIRERYLKFFREVLPEEEIMDISLPHMSTIHSFACSILYKMFGLRRTVLTEYHALKLLKSIMLEVLKLKKINADMVKSMYTLIGEVCANNELHFFCIPYFNLNGTLNEVKIVDDQINDIRIRIFDLFSRIGISMRLEGKYTEIDRDIKEDIKHKYASDENVSVSQFTEILKMFVEKKYLSNTMDFSDMRLLPFFILNQYKHLLNSIWEEYKYFLIDEAQDINTLDFTLAVTCDEDSYKRFLKL